MKYHFMICICLISVTLGSCQSHDTASFPYVLQADASYVMPTELAEISGITFVKGKTTSIYAIQDEEGLLFEYDLTNERVLEITSFGKKGDYEELTTDGKFFYVLKSNGDIYSFLKSGLSADLKVFANKGLVPEEEYEAMAFDPASGSLFLLCKACKADKKRNTVSGYMLARDGDGQLSYADQFTFQVGALSALDKRIKKTFKPSAMAKRSQSGEWYLLSSIDRALVVTDADFNPKHIVHLPRKNFEQPEGIAFDEEGNLYISSEAGRKEQGMIYRFNLIK